MSGYTKLDSGIIFSSVWQASLATRVVWITMLAMADRHGEVQTSLPGLSKAAGVTLEDCQEAIKIFSEPDVYSRTKDNDGRRIEEIDGGWVLLNHCKYRDLMSADDIRAKAADRQRRYRESRRSNVTSNACSVTRNALCVTGDVSNDIQSTEADTDSIVQSCTSTSTSTVQTKEVPPIIPLLPCNVTSDVTLKGKGKKKKPAPAFGDDYSPEVHCVVEYAKSKWRRSQPDGPPINPDWSQTRARVDRILSAPGLKMERSKMAEVLKKAIDIYIEKPRKAYKAPQFFFGPGKPEDPEPWKAYAKDAYHILNSNGANNAATG